MVSIGRAGERISELQGKTKEIPSMQRDKDMGKINLQVKKYGG